MSYSEPPFHDNDENGVVITATLEAADPCDKPMTGYNIYRIYYCENDIAYCEHVIAQKLEDGSVQNLRTLRYVCDSREEIKNHLGSSQAARTLYKMAGFD